jgi:hypothetical protein
MDGERGGGGSKRRGVPSLLAARDKHVSAHARTLRKNFRSVE